MESQLSFHLAAQLEGLKSCCYRRHQLLPCFSVHCRLSGFTTSVSPPRPRFCIDTVLSTGTLTFIFGKRNSWRQKSSSLVHCTSTPTSVSSPCISSSSEWSTEGQPPLVGSLNLPAPACWGAPLLLHLGLQYASAARTRIGSKKFAHCFDGNNIIPQPTVGGLSPPVDTLTSAFSRPPARSLPLWFPRHAELTPPSP